MNKHRSLATNVLYLIRVIDCDLKASKDLACRRVLVHRDLKLALWPALSVKRWRVVVEVHHPDCHRGNVVVHDLLTRAHLRRLGSGITHHQARQKKQHQCESQETQSTFTLTSYNSLLRREGYVVRVMHPLVLFMSKTPSLPERRQQRFATCH